MTTEGSTDIPLNTEADEVDVQSSESDKTDSLDQVISNGNENPDISESREQSEADLTDVEPGGVEPGMSNAVLVELTEALSTARAAESEAKDQCLRMQADMQNMRRRADRDVENAHKFALEKFATDLLPVFDSLERGLESVPEDDDTQKPAREGLVLTHKLFVDTLKRFSVEVLNPKGEPFNPEMHEAISMQPSDEVANNHVLNVFQKGFTLNGRLIRPAMVVVAKEK